jgi:uncharacterized protein YjbI with pentapeptide repeats
MALANVAALLSRWGRRVLIVDWDLEAPGIERYFEKVLIRSSRANTPGVIDLILSHVQGSKLDWHDCVLSAQPFTGGSPISIISAGQLTPEYPENVQKLNWNELFEYYALGPYLNSLRECWLEEFDVILIDSRTGINDLGGICTIILPDVLVLLFTTNAQSIEGVREVMHRARAAQDNLPVDRSRLIALPVLARDESRTEYEQAQKWRDRIAHEMGEFFRDWLLQNVSPHTVLRKLSIPSWPYWSFGEQLPVVEKPEELEDPPSLGAAYARLALLIDNQLDWKAVERLADPYELVEQRARAERLAKQVEEIKKERDSSIAKIFKYKWLSAALATVLPMAIIAFVAWMDYQEKQNIDELLKTAYNVTAPSALRLRAIRSLNDSSKYSLDLQNIDLSGLNLDGFDLYNSNMSKSILAFTSLEKVDLQKANLDRAILREANLERADLRGADLRGADLERADLRGADLRGAVLRGAVLERADLRGADLEYADLERADLRGADLRDAHLANTHVGQDQINVTCINEGTILPRDLTRPKPCALKQ